MQRKGYRVEVPDDERYRLVDQATRAAVAVPANIAEGHARGTRRDYAQFVAIAKGSLMELETHMISERLKYSSPERNATALKTISERSQKLTSLRQRLLEPQT